MSSWAELADAKLAELYGKVPDVGCKGLCWDACGPIDMGPRERQKLRTALRVEGSDLPPLETQRRLQRANGGYYRCPALTDDARCGHYELRPMVCRLWGAFEGMECPHGCTPEGGRLLRPMEALALVDAACRAGTSQEPHTEEELLAAYNSDPGVRAEVDAILKASKPVKPRVRRVKD